MVHCWTVFRPLTESLSGGRGTIGEGADLVEIDSDLQLRELTQELGPQLGWTPTLPVGGGIRPLETD